MTLLAGPDDFTTGPLIEDFGKTAIVDTDVAIDKNHVLNVAFDVGKQSETGEINRSFDSLARFLNMHVRAGLKPENINLALVVHGKAAYDLLSNKAYDSRFLGDNPNQALLAALLANDVDIYLCGQTAAYYDIKNSDLQKGVSMALSAMTAHALLQQQGYTLNPF
jgi:intracellular sulfur oxidation DsrE/DsrF family protein